MADHRTRRRVLGVVAALVAGAMAALLRRAKRPGAPPWGPAPQPGGDRDQGNVAVTLLRRGEVYRGPAHVSLHDPGRPTDRVVLAAGADGSYQGRAKPGTYRVDAAVEGGELRLGPTTITVRKEATNWPLELVAPEEPYLVLAGRVVPFVPRTDLLVVAASGSPAPELVERLNEVARERFGLVLVDPDTFEPTDGYGQTGFLVFRDEQGGGWADREKVEALGRLAAEVGLGEGDLRIGFLLDAGEYGRPMLDRRYLVRLDRDGDGDGASEGRELIARLEADVVRVLPEPDTYLIEFRDQDFRRHLRTLESLVAQGVFRYAEPSLVTLYTDLVDLSVYLAQYQGAPQPASVPLQRMEAPDAWAALVAGGNAAVAGALATVDRGIEVGSPFVAGVDVELRDWQGTPVASHAINLALPTPYHGMQVFGTASGNGHLGVWGVAPNLRHVAVQRSDAMGPDAFWDPFDELLAAGAKVVSISFKPNFTVWDSYSEGRINALVDAGMIIVVAAGNDRARLANVDGSQSTRPDATSNGKTLKWVTFPLAAHARTVTVGSTQLGDPEEQYWDGSGGVGTNRGDALDLCALATNYLTCATGTTAGPASGTSLAAPLVAATAAAVRALRPHASVAQVKALLCSSSRRIRAGEGFWGPGAPPADWDPTVTVPDHHLRYGYGQLDVAETLARALNLP